MIEFYAPEVDEAAEIVEIYHSEAFSSQGIGEVPKLGRCIRLQV